MSRLEARTPTVTLDADEISHDMAARLTIALLGQMLYMKGQVPFPVASLGRMVERHPDVTASRTAQRAAKKRTEFLQSYDDLKSHLHTTFVALSTALASNETKHPLSPPFTLTRTSPAMTQLSMTQNQAFARRRPAKVHVLLILGPSPSAAKARLLLELDGLHVERFGEREYLRREEVETEQDGSDGASEHDAENGSVPVLRRQRTLSSPPRTPPPALSHDPHSPTTSSPAHFLQPSHQPATFSPDSSFSPSSPISSCETLPSDEESCGPQTQPPEETNPFGFSQRAEEAALRAGERLLSQAIFAGGEGLGFGNEIPPTHAHILIRAPRCLAHPTWVPRQNLGSMLDRHVERFLDLEGCPMSGEKLLSKRWFGVGLKTVGVRVQCQQDGDETGEVNGCKETKSDEEVNDAGSNEGDGNDSDDMIWWSWDGKLAGFSD